MRPLEFVIGAPICRRLDDGTMRWIRVRAEAVLQLRCVDANGAWEDCVNFVHDETRAEAETKGTRMRLQRRKSQALPERNQAA